MPLTTAAIANTPYGVNDTMNFVALPMASLAMPSTSRSRALRGTPMSASPTTTLNSTTAGTMLLASELNGLVGMYRPRKSNPSRSCSSVVLKNEALSCRGKISVTSSAAARAMAHNSNSTTPTRLPSVRACSPSSAPSPATIEIVTYGSTVICSSRT